MSPEASVAPSIFNDLSNEVQQTEKMQVANDRLVDRSRLQAGGGSWAQSTQTRTRLCASLSSSVKRRDYISYDLRAPTPVNTLQSEVKVEPEE